jgi:hypothetical protein
MVDEREIGRLVNQIKALNIKQDNLLGRLSSLTSEEGRRSTGTPTNRSGRGRTTSRAVHDQGVAGWAIGDRVRIKNPGKDQPSRGRISKITASRVTVTGRNGVNVSRAPVNVEWDDN